MPTTKRKPVRKARVAEVLVLRTCDANMKSYNGFQWPKRGVVKCSDWNATTSCGNGLHGLLWGDGDGSLLNWNSDAKWLVVAVPEKSIVSLGRKVKFPAGRVVFLGDRTAATDYILSHGAAARQKAVVGCSLTGGVRSTLTGGHASTLTGGDCSTLTGGHDSMLTGGDRSTLTGGHDSMLTGGDRSTLTGGYYSTLTGGHDSTLTGGHCSTLTGGDCSTLTGGHDSTLTGGDRSTLNWKVWDGSYYRIHTIYVGENGIKPNTPYRFENGKVVEVPKP